MIFLAGLVLDQGRFEQSKPVQICPVSIPEPAMMGLGKKWGLLLRIRDDHHDIGSSRSRTPRRHYVGGHPGVVARKLDGLRRTWNRAALSAIQARVTAIMEPESQAWVHTEPHKE